MKTKMITFLVLAGLPAVRAADLEAGKARVATVCAACHGANGVSVAAAIPNLAGQKVDYLTKQLRAFRAGERRNELMNAIAGQLNDQDIDNAAAFLASLPGPAVGSMKSEFLPNVATTRVVFPSDYQTRFTKYLTMNFPDDKELRYFYASPAAFKAAAAAAPLPDGSMILMEVYSSKLDAQGNPVTGSDGFFVPDQIVGYVAMERRAGWGAQIPEMLRNAEWNYAPFTTEKVYRSGFNQAQCLACHKPQSADSHLFTMKQLRAAAQAH